jgi:hypothetical protein
MTQNNLLAVEADAARHTVEAAREAVRIFNLALEVDRYHLGAETINSIEFQNLRMELRADLSTLERAAVHLELIRNALERTDGELSFIQAQVAVLLTAAQEHDTVTRGQAWYLIEQAAQAFTHDTTEVLISWDGLHDALFDYVEGDPDARALRPDVTLETIRRAVAESLVTR